MLSVHKFRSRSSQGKKEMDVLEVIKYGDKIKIWKSMFQCKIPISHTYCTFTGTVLSQFTSALITIKLDLY